jgi:hypothetical protein
MKMHAGEAAQRAVVTAKQEHPVLALEILRELVDRYTFELCRE